MYPSRRALSQFVSLIAALFIVQAAYGQGTFPPAGERMRYTVYIEMPRAYISGIGILKNDGETLTGSIFNEFGVSALDFTYAPQRRKVRLLSVMPMLDKWYIRKTLRSDLRLLLDRLSSGETTYTNAKRHITYRFTPMEAAADEEDADAEETTVETTVESTIEPTIMNHDTEE